MGLICYNNIAANASSMTYTGITDGANLITANIQPKATLTASTDNRVQAVWAQNRIVECAALLGVEFSSAVAGLTDYDEFQSFYFPIVIETSPDGSAWSVASPSDYTIYRIRETPFSAEHIVAVFDAGVTVRGMRITLCSGSFSGYSGKAGAVFFGSVIRSASLLRKNSSILASDTSTKSRSQARQIYTADGSVGRIVDVQFGDLPEHQMFGGFPNPTVVESFTVGSSGGVTDLGNGFYQNTTAGGLGTLNLNGMEAPTTDWARLEYEAWVDVAGSGELACQLIAETPQGSRLPFGRTFHVGSPAVSSPIQITLAADTGQKITVGGFRWLVQGDKAINRQWVRGGVSDFIAKTGTSKPCIVIATDDQFRIASTGIYGIPESYQPIASVGGDLWTGGFTLEELL